MFQNGVSDESGIELSLRSNRSFNRDHNFFSSLRKSYPNQARSNIQSLAYISNKKLMKSLSKKQPIEEGGQLKRKRDKVSLLDLPIETLVHICKHLLTSPKALAALAETCSTLLNVIMLRLDDGQDIPFFPLLEIIRKEYCFVKATEMRIISERKDIVDKLNIRGRSQQIDVKNITAYDIEAVLSVLEKNKRNKELVNKYGNDSSTSWKAGCLCMCINILLIVVASAQYSRNDQDWALILTLLGVGMCLASLCVPWIICEVVHHRNDKFDKKKAFLNIRNDILSRNAPQPLFISAHSSDDDLFAEDDSDDYDTYLRGFSSSG